MDEKPLKIAVVGAGVAGLTAAYVLQRKHTLTLFEKSAQVGGHTNTIVIPSGPEKWTPVDTGFVLFNERDYPSFHRLLGQLGVAVRNADLSFGYSDEKTGLQYSLAGFNGRFAQRSNFWKPSFLLMLREIHWFNRKAKKDLRRGELGDQTLEEYLGGGGFSKNFTHDYLLPLGSSVWASSLRQLMEIPAGLFLRSLEVRGFLGNPPPKWQTVVEGSHNYVRALLKKSVMRVKVADPVEEIDRRNGQIKVRTKSGKEEVFDKVVMACHADEVLGLLAEPSEDEQRLFSAWRYEKNFAVLHTDRDVMPSLERAWAGWNYIREKETTMSEPASVTYHMNRIQGLPTMTQYFVTFNRVRPIPEKYVLKEIYYTHPSYTKEAVETQKEMPKLNGVNNTYFCGSYFGSGTHEDAVKSAVTVAGLFGLEL